MYIYNALILCVFLFASSVSATEITGQGWGDTEAAAKKEALLDISQRISVTVRSESRTSQTVTSQSLAGKKSEDFKQLAENVLETSSELPILGAEFVVSKQGAQVSAKAVLETSRSLPLYEKRLEQLQNRLTALNASVAKAQSAELQYNSLMDLFILLDEFKKMNTVASYLGGKTQLPGVDEDALRSQLRVAMKRVDTLELAAKLLTQGMTESGVHIFPARARNSNEITQFAGVMKDKMAVHIKTAASPKEAGFILSGEYEESENGIDITYYLLDSNSVAKKTNSIRIPRQVYSGLQTVPKSVDFEKLLKAGVAVSGDLRVDVSTNAGGHDLLFSEGQEVELFIKLSEMGYFYVVGHTLKDGDNNSYLVEMSEARGQRKFVKFVNADDASKWISIGKFQVTPPFGVEGLQVVASTKDLLDSVPTPYLDKQSGLFLISTSPNEGVVKTRALVKKKSDKAQVSEATLMFTTKSR